jgi:hypothetical protein
MERINVDGKWYVEEKSTQDFDITYSYEASSGIFDFSVVLKEVDDGKRFEIIYGTCGVEAYIDGRFKESEYWDNDEWIRKVRDGVDSEALSEVSFLTDIQLMELQYLLIAVTDKGWL